MILRPTLARLQLILASLPPQLSLAHSSGFVAALAVLRKTNGDVNVKVSQMQITLLLLG
jgi:hypothetical protein